jgi:hypothetical protein
MGNEKKIIIKSIIYLNFKNIRTWVWIIKTILITFILCLYFHAAILTRNTLTIVSKYYSIIRSDLYDFVYDLIQHYINKGFKRKYLF